MLLGTRPRARRLRPGRPGLVVGPAVGRTRRAEAIQVAVRDRRSGYPSKDNVSSFRAERLPIADITIPLAD